MGGWSPNKCPRKATQSHSRCRILWRSIPKPEGNSTIFTECLLLISLRLLQTEHRCWCIHLRPWKRIVAATRLDKSKIDLDSIEVVSKSWAESFYVQQLSSIRTSTTKVVQKENQIKWAFLSIQLHDTTSTLAFIQVFGIDWLAVPCNRNVGLWHSPTSKTWTELFGALVVVVIQHLRAARTTKNTLDGILATWKIGVVLRNKKTITETFWITSSIAIRITSHFKTVSDSRIHDGLMASSCRVTQVWAIRQWCARSTPRIINLMRMA